MQLTARDKEIIGAVCQYRVMRQDQIQTLFFGVNPGARVRAQRRLVKLFDFKYLARFFLPTRGGLMCSPTLYGLDKRGAELLRAEFGYDGLHWYSNMKELKDDFLEHTLAIADFRVAVTAACQKAGYDLLAWKGESELKADYDRVNVRTAKGYSRSVSIIPDGYFVIDTPLGKSHFFLELDRGTMTTARFRGKVEAYVAYFQQGYQRRYGTKSLRVLTVTVGEQRLANLKRVTEQVSGTNWFWFGLLSQLGVDQVLSAPVWQVAGREDNQLLIVPA
ncbi:MAG: replication-relaxation family protein [Aggregatilineales bacterium]